ncbi:hypothetical protein ACHAXA_000111 [Cyclostephanos tholiformis]|uniref:quinolinate synthase n=1 Tax=Cyclostephanos tholiformis TaxID=382380 RepID=A0ABD3RY04_9STRA
MNNPLLLRSSTLVRRTLSRRADACRRPVGGGGGSSRRRLNVNVGGYDDDDIATAVAFHRRTLSSSSSSSSSTAARGVGGGGGAVNPRKTTATAPPSAPVAQQASSPFPSLIVGPDRSLTPLGPFASAQASYLDPPNDVVVDLLDRLLELNVGIVAHYYMDVELQGVLHAIARRQAEMLRIARDGGGDGDGDGDGDGGGTRGEGTTDSIMGGGGGGRRRVPEYPVVTIADSLKMGDDAVRMCEYNSASSIICLGVDFMSESVMAIMGRNGHGHVPVYRAASRGIGCSLAESAESDGYRAWLVKCANDGRTLGKKSLHVIYINTSLETKAVSSSLMPTITCTSSNVLQTILQASSQLGPDVLRVCYGPDTYMGENLISLLDAVLESSDWSDERIRDEMHPEHDRSTLRMLRDNIVVYPHGNCVVHHMFGSSVVDAVIRDYPDAYVTAHLEVPGEMFQIALRRSHDDMGVVGSTSNILNFIERKVGEAAASAPHSREDVGGEDGGGTIMTTTTPTGRRRLRFILGTEAGMVTSIVRSVQDILESSGCRDLEAEIVFPVSSEAVMGVDDDDDDLGMSTAIASTTNALGVVPGSAGGEGCSAAGGCATCPFMKMNDLDAVHDLIDMIGRLRMSSSSSSSSSNARDELRLSEHLPPNRLSGKYINGRDAIELGTEPIVYMREFMKGRMLSKELVERVERAGRMSPQ